MKITGFGIPIIEYTASGMPSADINVIQELTGDPENGKFGKAFDHFNSLGQPELGKSLCTALDSHLKLGKIDTLIQTFMRPL